MATKTSSAAALPLPPSIRCIRTLTSRCPRSGYAFFHWSDVGTTNSISHERFIISSLQVFELRDLMLDDCGSRAFQRSLEGLPVTAAADSSASRRGESRLVRIARYDERTERVVITQPVVAR